MARTHLSAASGETDTEDAPDGVTGWLFAALPPATLPLRKLAPARLPPAPLPGNTSLLLKEAAPKPASDARLAEHAGRKLEAAEAAAPSSLETLPERAGRKPEAERRLNERLRSDEDTAREGGPGASGCRNKTTTVIQRRGQEFKKQSGGNLSG